MVLTDPSQIWIVEGSGWYQPLVVRVIDGDTVEIEGGQSVRYIGIDAPDIVRSTEPVEH